MSFVLERIWNEKREGIKKIDQWWERISFPRVLNFFLSSYIVHCTLYIGKWENATFSLETRETGLHIPNFEGIRSIHIVTSWLESLSVNLTHNLPPWNFVQLSPMSYVSYSVTLMLLYTLSICACMMFLQHTSLSLPLLCLSYTLSVLGTTSISFLRVFFPCFFPCMLQGNSSVISECTFRACLEREREYKYIKGESRLKVDEKRWHEQVMSYFL